MESKSFCVAQMCFPVDLCFLSTIEFEKNKREVTMWKGVEPFSKRLGKSNFCFLMTTGSHKIAHMTGFPAAGPCGGAVKVAETFRR